MALRVGGVPYGVGAPLVRGLDLEADLELVREPPSKLARDLREGVLDAALVSSIEAFRRPGYRLVEGLGIASDGPVRSVRAFLRAGCELRDVRRVGADSGSESSVALLQILLARAGAFDYELERVEPDLEPDRLPHDLVLLIGDHGLRAEPGDRRVIDLGEAWRSWTGLPFVYAVWLLSPSAPVEPLLESLHRALLAAEREGVDDGTHGSVYYRIGDREMRGLRHFRNEAAALGLADVTCEPMPVGRRPASQERNLPT